MNQKQFITLIVLFIVIGGLGLFLYQKNTASWTSSDQDSGGKLLGDLPVNEVAQITIQDSNATVNLVKEEDQWKVRERYGYPANFSEVREFLIKAHDLKGIQKVKVGPSQLPRLELLPPAQNTNSGTLVELKGKDGKPIGSLLLGKKHMRQSPNGGGFGGDGGWPDGRYVLINDGQTAPNVWLISDPMTTIEPKPEQWINKDFFKVEKVKSIAVTSTNATNHWKLVRETETGEWKLADKKEGEELDSSKTSSMNYALSSPSFNDVLPPDTKAEDLGLGQPPTAVIETFDQFTYRVDIGSPTNNDTYPIKFTVEAALPKERTPGKDEKPEDKEKLDKEFQEKVQKQKDKLAQEKALEQWTYLVSKWTIDPLLKSRADLMAAPKTEEAKTESTATNSAEDHDHDHDHDEPVAADAANVIANPLLPPVPAPASQEKKE